MRPTFKRIWYLAQRHEVHRHVRLDVAGHTQYNCFTRDDRLALRTICALRGLYLLRYHGHDDAL